MAKKVRRPNVKDGVLAPLGNGFSLAIGKHPEKTDDIDIGPNNKNGLSVNHGEILQQKGNTVRVFSAEPMFGGLSPSQLLYGGMAPDKVFAMQEQYKRANRINDDGSSKAKFGILKKLKSLFSNKDSKSETQTPVEENYLSYFDATDEQKQKAHLSDKKGKYDIYSFGPYDDTHFSVVEARYKSITDSMKRKGFTDEEIKRLRPFLISQQVLEGGYKLAKDNNNFGGLLDPKTREQMSFNSIDDFNDYYINNLDEKWGDNYLGKGKGWRNAKTLQEYTDIINREDLHLHTKEAHAEYNRQHKDKPAYIYTPLWENNFTGLMSQPKLGGIYPRVYGMIDLLEERINDWDNIAKTNNIVAKLFGGQTNINSLGERPNANQKNMKNKRTKSLTGTQVNLINAGANTLGSLIGAGIQQGAISGMEFTPRRAAFYNPVKLKTKINIEPQITKLKEIQAQLADAARRTSGSSRTAYQKILAGHNSLLESAMGLYGQKENQETQLINQDILNQQAVAHKNTKEHFDVLNYNLETPTNLRNQKRVLTSNNWTTALNTDAGAWRDFVDSENARRVKAAELYTQAISNPTAAKLMYGDIDFANPAKQKEAMDAIYNYLNNQRLG